MIKKPFQKIVAGLFVFVATNAVQAQNTSDKCEETGIVIGFFNGVQTTEEQADVALKEIELIYKTTSPKGESIEYELFYNHSKGLSDFVETFDQRLTEQNGLLAGRFELFLGSASQTVGYLTV